MERFEEKIIDLVDVVAGPEPGHTVEKTSTIGLSQTMQPHTDIQHVEMDSLFQKEVETASSAGLEQAPNHRLGPDHNDLETLVRAEVERLLRTAINENIQKMMREILTQEVEKAIAREIEILKKTS